MWGGQGLDMTPRQTDARRSEETPGAAGRLWGGGGGVIIPRWLAVAVIVLGAVGAELAVPVLWGDVREGLMVTEQVVLAHKGQPDPPTPHPAPEPDPPPEPPTTRDDPEGATVSPPQALWYVVRRNRPTVPVYGPWLWDRPECRAIAARAPELYRCLRLP